MKRKHTIVRILICFLLLIYPAWCLSEEFEAFVSFVNDGDTIEAIHCNPPGSPRCKTITIRLNGIDCPEMGQSFGNEAKRSIYGLVFGKDIIVKTDGKDKYGRTIAEITADGKNINQELVRAGLAWHYEKYSSDSKLKELQENAKKEGRGIWNSANPMAPWDWREQKRQHERQSFKEISEEKEDHISKEKKSKTTGDRNIQTGPRGGRYYYNENGKKVYLKRK